MASRSPPRLFPHLLLPGLIRHPCRHRFRLVASLSKVKMAPKRLQPPRPSGVPGASHRPMMRANHWNRSARALSDLIESDRIAL